MAGASGSAIKGIKLVPQLHAGPVHRLVSVGYDQRLSLWNIEEPPAEEKEGEGSELLLPGPGVVWAAGAMVNASDVGSVDVGQDSGSAEGKGALCCVVGEGLQLFKLIC